MPHAVGVPRAHLGPSQRAMYPASIMAVVALCVTILMMLPVTGMDPTINFVVIA
jgi:hypothetical protein